VHLQPYYRRKTPDLDLPGAMTCYGRSLSLPIYPGMTDADVDHVVEALGRAIGLGAMTSSRGKGAA
jgi:dTDP-4-amino-4,6-dideoxygalactose transaminase